MTLKGDVLASMVTLVRPHLLRWTRQAGKEHRVSALIRKIGIKRTCHVTCRVILERAFSDPPLMSCAIRLGTRLEFENEAARYGDSEAWRLRYTRLKTATGKDRPIKFKQLDARFKIEAAVTLLRLIEHWTGWIAIRPSREGNGTLHVSVVAEVVEMLRSKRERYHDPESRIPQATPPGVRPIVTHRGRPVPVEVPATCRAMLQKQQGVAWRINQNVFQVLEQAFDTGRPLGGVPGGDKPEAHGWLPKRDWGRLQQYVYEWTVKRRNAGRALADGATLPSPIMHFFWTLDFRGRTYPSAGLVSPQGSDIGRALLEHAEGTPIGKGRRYLAHHGANMWGLSKSSYTERERWVRENTEHIIRSARDPFTHRWWEAADKPWRFLAFCFEWSGLAQHGANHVTHLSCQIDGTCNVLQIVALLTRNARLARMVNCTDGPRPEDFYSLIAAKVGANMKQQGGYYNTEWLRILDGEVPRDAVKASTIDLLYGAGRELTSKRLRGWFWDQDFDFPFKGQVFKPCIVLAAKIRAALRTTVPEVFAFRGWCSKVAKIIGETSSVLSWTTPSGFPVHAQYFKRRPTSSIRVSTLDRMDVLQDFEDTDSPDVRKMMTALFAHLVQGLDAAAMTLVVNACDFPVSSIHDCFGALAPHMERLHQIVRREYVRVFQEDVLADIAGQLDEEPPEGIGDFDVHKVLHSRYFFT